jgi:TetR/AcrR family transcriptional repressor of nem operon
MPGTRIRNRKSGNRTPREASKGAETRRRIIEQAAPLFNTQGYAGSSVSALMAATGLKKGGIYRHFESKEELAAEAFDYAWDVASRARRPAIDEDSPNLLWIRQLVDSFPARKSAVPGGCPILNTAIDSDDGNALLRQRAMKALKSWHDRVAGIVARAIVRGEVKASVDPRTVAVVVIATLEGALMMSRLERDEDALRRVAKELGQYLDGLMASSRA